MESKKKTVKKPVPAVVKELTVSTFKSADNLINKLSSVQNVDIVKLEKLLELKGKYEAEENKKVFQRKFAELQADLPVIQKTKKVMDGNRVLYQYAPLEKILEQVKPFLKKYGFSYRWSEGLIEKEGYKRIYCHLMGHGHEQMSYCDIPIPPANKLVNNAQSAGSASTYGKRYSFIAITGVVADEDDDGRSVKTPPPKTESQLETKDAYLKAIKLFTAKYVQFKKIQEPAQGLKEFMAHIETKTIKEITGATEKLNQLIIKYGGKNK